MRQINIAEAKAKLSELVQQALAGEEIWIARDGKPQVRLAALPQPHRRTPGLSRGAVAYVAANFDAPLDDFHEYER